MPGPEVDHSTRLIIEQHTAFGVAKFSHAATAGDQQSGKLALVVVRAAQNDELFSHIVAAHQMNITRGTVCANPFRTPSTRTGA